MLIKTIDQDKHTFEYIRIDRGDAYSMDVTLARVVHPMLKMLQRDKHGIPSEFILDHPGSDQMRFEFIEEMSDQQEEKAAAIWADKIDQMIFAFQEIAYGRYLGSDIYLKPAERDAYYERLQTGLRLFAKHYFSLWT